MNIDFQTVQDTLIALSAVIGFAVVFAIAIFAAAGLVQRDKRRNARTSVVAPVTGPAQHATQSDDRQLVLR